MSMSVPQDGRGCVCHEVLSCCASLSVPVIAEKGEKSRFLSALFRIGSALWMPSLS